jgi:hypothetical protein
MTYPERLCACGREAIDVLRVASEDGVLLIPLCAECAEDPLTGEQGELFGPPQRRPLTAMAQRAAEIQQELPLDSAADEEQGAA